MPVLSTQIDPGAAEFRRNRAHHEKLSVELREILAAVRRGVEAPAASIPVFERSRRPPPDLAYDARLERLKSVRNAIAAELPLAPGVLCPNAILEAIARQEPASLEGLTEIGEMRRWQRAVLGERLIAALSAA